MHSIPIRRLPLGVGDEAELIVPAIDAETLGVERRSRKYVRLQERRWRVDDRTSTIEFDVDDYGIPTDIGDELRRVAAHTRAVTPCVNAASSSRTGVPMFGSRRANAIAPRGIRSGYRCRSATRESTPWNGARLACARSAP